MEPGLLALAHRRAAVASVSPAAPTHLAEAVATAVAWSGPALVHVHAPWSVQPDGALVAARAALARREHLLVRYDPAAEGVFGTRVTLDPPPGGRSQGDGDGDGDGTAAGGVAPERAEVLALWSELAGQVSPFVARVRATVEAEVAAERGAEIAELRASHAAALAGLRPEIEGEAVERLTERLMTLAGYGGG